MLKTYLPEAKYTNKHDATARLARVLQEIFNKQPMMVNGAVHPHKFSAYPKLDPKSKAAWDAIFAPGKRPAPSVPTYVLALASALLLLCSPQ